MRDDIHKRLPLPRAWKRLVRSTTRESERRTWIEHARNAAAFELEQLSPGLRVAATRSVEQPNLFGGVDPRLRELALSPIDQDFVRELAIARHRDPRAAMHEALRGATESRVSAQLRSVREHAASESPKDALPLHHRLLSVFRSVDFDPLISRAIEGRPLAPPPPSGDSIDFDVDIRLGVQ